MEDTITKCVAVSGADGKLSRYQVTFSIDFSASKKPNKDLVVSVHAAYLKNATDLTEVKIAACKKAKVMKARLIASSEETSTVVTMSGPVAL